jgi:hypothetical protein
MPMESPSVNLHSLMCKDVLLLHGGQVAYHVVHGWRWCQQRLDKAAWGLFR